MRITENIRFSEITSNIQRNLQRYFDANEKVVTGKIINRPSDNPAGMKELLSLRSFEASIGQFQTNISKASHNLETADLLFGRAAEILSEAKEIAISDTKAANSDTRDIAAIQVGGLLEEMLSIANTRVDGKYIFAGYQTGTQPFNPADPTFTYNGDSGVLTIAIDERRKMPVNFTGDAVFKGSGGGVDILSQLDALKTALENDDVAAISAAITSMETARDQVVKEQAAIGVRLNELVAKKEDMNNFRNNVLNRISDIEDAHLAEAVMEMTQMQNAYEASLNASSMFMETSLMDFIR